MSTHSQSAGHGDAFPVVAGRLSGKVALVTAAAQGIGRATALRLAEEGANVVAIDVNAEKLNTFSHARISTRQVDATDVARMAAAIGSIPHLDVLVSCVGWVHHGTLRLFARRLDSGVSSQCRYALSRHPIRSARHAAAGCRKHRQHCIACRSPCRSYRAAYSATKAAVVGITRSVAIDFAKDGVRCNAICPAMVETPSLEERINALPDPVAARALFISRHPVGRLGRPEEVAALAAYLASDESAFMTGATLQLDGGAAA